MKKTKNGSVEHAGVKLLLLLLGFAAIIMLVALLVSKEVINKESGTNLTEMSVEGLTLLMTFFLARKQRQKRLLIAITFATAFACVRFVVGVLAFSNCDLNYSWMLFAVLAGAGGRNDFCNEKDSPMRMQEFMQVVDFGVRAIYEHKMQEKLQNQHLQRVK